MQNKLSVAFVLKHFCRLQIHSYLLKCTAHFSPIFWLGFYSMRYSSRTLYLQANRETPRYHHRKHPGIERKLGEFSKQLLFSSANEAESPQD